VNRSRIVPVAIGVAALVGLSPITSAQADPAPDDTFLTALRDAGIGYNDPASTEQLGQSICPMLVEPGKSLASVYSTVSNNGINPDMAAFFTGIAISMYCPSMVSSLGNGTFLNNINGFNGLPIPGL
jgi:hypothetical protein